MRIFFFRGPPRSRGRNQKLKGKKKKKLTALFLSPHSPLPSFLPSLSFSLFSSQIRTWFQQECHRAIERGNATFRLLRDATEQLQTWLRDRLALPQAAEGRGADLNAAIGGFVGSMRAVLTKAHATEERIRIFAGGLAHQTSQSVRGLEDAKGDPADFRSEAFRMLNDGDHARAAQQAHNRVEELRGQNPGRASCLSTACCLHETALLRVPARDPDRLSAPECARKKLAAYLCALSDRTNGQFAASSTLTTALGALSESCGGAEPPPTGDDAYAPGVDADDGIATLEREILPPPPPPPEPPTIAADFRHFCPLRVMRRARNFVTHHYSSPARVPAAAARAFLVRVTSGLDAPCRLKDRDLGIFEILEELGGDGGLILHAVDAIAVRACEKHILVRFARRLGDLAREPLDVTGVRADVLDRIYAISPPGLEDPLAALVLIRSGLLAVSDPIVLDSSGVIAAHQVSTNFPYDLQPAEFSAIVGAAKTIGTSLLGLNPGAISVSDPVLDGLLDAQLRGRGFKRATGRVVASLCQTLYFDLLMAYSGGVFVEVVLPVEQRVIISVKEAERDREFLVPGDKILRAELNRARGCRFSSRSSSSPSVSCNGVFVNSMGASGVAMMASSRGNDAVSAAAVEKAVEVLVASRYGDEENLPPAFIAGGEMATSPIVPAPYTRVVHLPRTGHVAGGKGTLVSCCFWFFAGEGEREEGTAEKMKRERARARPNEFFFFFSKGGEKLEGKKHFLRRLPLSHCFTPSSPNDVPGGCPRRHARGLCGRQGGAQPPRNRSAGGQDLACALVESSSSFLSRRCWGRL